LFLGLEISIFGAVLNDGGGLRGSYSGQGLQRCLIGCVDVNGGKSGADEKSKANTNRAVFFNIVFSLF